MSVPVLGELSLSKIAKEKAYSDYNSATAIFDVSLKGIEVDGLYGAVNSQSPSKPDGAVPCAMSEWYSYDHDFTTTIYVEVELQEAVSENMRYGTTWNNGVGTKTLSVNYLLLTASGPFDKGTGSVSASVTRNMPDSTVEDATTIYWIFDGVTMHTKFFAAGASVVGESYTFTNVEGGNQVLKILIQEG
jgi:hypothetical protein